MKVSKFDALFEKIPKDPEVWTGDDVLVWLKLIGMEKYAENFSEMKVDGLLILELKEEELLEELKIEIKLHRKKIIKAIELLQEYHAYFKEGCEGDQRKGNKPAMEEDKDFGVSNRIVNADQLTKAQEGGSQRRNRIIEDTHPEHSRFKNASPNKSSEMVGNIKQIFNRPFIEHQNSMDIQEMMPVNPFANKGGSMGMVGNSQHQNAINPSTALMPGNMNIRSNTTDNLEGYFDQSQPFRVPGYNGPQVNYLNTNRSAENRANIPAMMPQNQVANANKPALQNAPKNPDKNYIIINSIEGATEVSHTINEQGARIGRHSSNQIVIYDESVSRHHAEIFFDYSGNMFYLKDIGSTTGTFLKITDPVELKLDMILEIGSYQLMVSNILVHASNNIEDTINNSSIEFTIYESPEETPDRVFTLSSGSSIGRKANNAVCFSDDLHMSNLHCKVNLIGHQFFFEDMASTNGSWLRLSKESIDSQPVLLSNQTVFKIGNSAMYEVIIPNATAANNDSNTINNNAPSISNGQSNLCTICWDAERDCLIMPCKHNVSCTRCIKSVKNCPICRRAIADIIKIYKA